MHKKLICVFLAVLSVISTSVFTFNVSAVKDFSPVFPLADTSPCVTCYCYYNTGTPHNSSGYGSNSNAIDFAVPTGTAVYAIEDGTITFADWDRYSSNGGYGKYITISHLNGERSLYGHLSELVVSNGCYVSRGQLIGYSGNTGNSSGAHLHFAYSGDDLFRNIWLAQIYSTITFMWVRDNNAKYNSDQWVVNLIDTCYTTYHNGKYCYNGSPLIANYIGSTATATATSEPNSVIARILREKLGSGIKASLMKNAKVDCYNSYGYSSKAGRIYESDIFTITEIRYYGNEYWARIRCPWGSYDKTVYVPLKELVPDPNAETAWKSVATCQITTYRHADCSTVSGYVGTGDTFYILGTVNGVYLVIYPLSSGGWKLAWA